MTFTEEMGTSLGHNKARNRLYVRSAELNK